MLNKLLYVRNSLPKALGGQCFSGHAALTPWGHPAAS